MARGTADPPDAAPVRSRQSGVAGSLRRVAARGAPSWRSKTESGGRVCHPEPRARDLPRRFANDTARSLAVLWMTGGGLRVTGAGHSPNAV